MREKVERMINARFVPVSKWPGAPKPSYSRRRATFRIAYGKRLDLLEFELNKLRATDIIIQVYLKSSDIRNDGWPRSSARPDHPGVILTFQKGKETLSFPCDTYDAWEDNLYAIALSLEALRSVDRYGVTRNAEQYQGWKAIAAPAKEESPSREWAIEHLARVSGTEKWFLKDDDSISAAYRLAAKKTHPDMNGGDRRAFELLQKAMEVIRL